MNRGQESFGALLAPLSLILFIRMIFFLSTELPQCFKERLSVVRFNREVSAEKFDTPLPRQLALNLASSGALYK